MRRSVAAALMSLVLAACNVILGTSDVTGPVDGAAAEDASEVPPAATKLRGPSLGQATGSVHATASLRPRFAWHPTPGATRYEVQIDDSCAIAAFRGCLFPSPEVTAAEVVGVDFVPSADLPVAMVRPVGRRYYWRVRACNDHGCGDYSDVWYLDVGRQRDDVNGDGYGDVVVGISSGALEAATVGRAYLVFGQAGLGAPVAVTLPDPRDVVDGRFGSAVAMVGDLNADGYGDVAVGSWRTPRASHLGWVYVYAGRGTWPSVVELESGGYGLAEPDAADHFGSAIVGGGDVNGDGYADFAVSALEPSLAATEPGYVYVNYGRPTLPVSQLGSDRVVLDPGAGASSLFGWSLGLGDVDEDGFADLLVGAIGRAALAGDASVFIGGRDAGIPPIMVTSASMRLMPGIPGPAAFGFASARCGRLMALGAPLESAPGQGAGRLRLYRARVPLPAEVQTYDGVIDDPSGAIRASFGTDLACDDVTADGRPDLVASAPTPDDDGAVLLFGDADSLPTTPFATLTAGTGVVGHRIKLTDFNGDGIADVVASRLRGPLTPQGALLVWLGRQAWPAAITSADLTVPNPSGVAAERFGEAID